MEGLCCQDEGKCCVARMEESAVLPGCIEVFCCQDGGKCCMARMDSSVVAKMEGSAVLPG